MIKEDFFSTYEIEFANKDIGEHIFNFHVSSDFFSYFENSLVEQLESDVKIVLSKQDEGLFILNFLLKGKMNLRCDRCLSKFDFPFESNQKVVLKIGEKNENNEAFENIAYVGYNDTTLNISKFIYEFISEKLPMKKTCDLIGKKCDEQMLSKLDDLSLNSKENKIDPRWEGLKKLKNKLKEE
ncbi:MAG: DUF177 domain-containing protein [Bacteroidota bacterium]|nr:DUF177 domain-containing protein [Bacteroidota bacterium]